MKKSKCCNADIIAIGSVTTQGHITKHYECTKCLQPCDVVSKHNWEGITDDLIKELKKDKEEGSYYYTWQANIAMAMYDELNGKATKEECNNGAKRFLDLLINSGE